MKGEKEWNGKGKNPFTNERGNVEDEEKAWGGGKGTPFEEDFNRQEAERHGYEYRQNPKYGHWEYSRKSASNPDDEEHFDRESMFNRFKFTRQNTKKEKKVYEKYEPKEDSNFHNSRRGF